MEVNPCDDLGNGKSVAHQIIGSTTVKWNQTLLLYGYEVPNIWKSPLWHFVLWCVVQRRKLHNKLGHIKLTIQALRSHCLLHHLIQFTTISMLVGQECVNNCGKLTECLGITLSIYVPLTVSHNWWNYLYRSSNQWHHRLALPKTWSRQKA